MEKSKVYSQIEKIGMEFIDIINFFLRNIVLNYLVIMDQRVVDYNMYLQINFLDPNLDFFPVNLDVSSRK